MGGTAVLTVTGSAIIDLSQASLVNTGSMSLSIGPNSLLLVPAGFNPATAFGSYGNAGLLHNVGTPLTMLPGQGFSGNGSLADHVYCQGAIAAATGGAINLNGGITVSGTGNVNLGTYGTFTVNDSCRASAPGRRGIRRLCRLLRHGNVYAVRRSEQRQLPLPWQLHG